MVAGQVYADQLVFTLGNVVAITIATVSVVTTVLAWVYSARNNKAKIKTIAGDVAYLKEYVDLKMKDLRDESKTKEEVLHRRIDEVRLEQKEAVHQLSQKMDGMNTQLQTINANLAELNGYLRAHKESKS